MTAKKKISRSPVGKNDGKKGPNDQLHCIEMTVKQKNVLSLIVLALILLSVLSGCFGGAHEQFLGLWDRSDSLMQIQFKDDHLGTWRVRNDTNSQWNSIAFLYTIDSDRVLTLSAKEPGNDFGETISYDFAFENQEQKVLILVIDGIYWSFRRIND